MNDKLKIYSKGILMGICDLIPGISGGTIAFITGIYERLILAIKNITPQNYFKYFISIITFNKKNRKKIEKEIDIYFLIILFLGIITSILLGARLISYLYENYTSYVLVLFLGLIISSLKIIYDEIQTHSKSNTLFLIIGIIIGLSLLFLIPREILNPTKIQIAIGGFFAIMALFLPGISGSFILLIMGLYEHIINYVKNIKEEFVNLIPFVIGAIGGVYIISRIITYLFKKDKSKTLYGLIGLVIGSSSILIEKIYLNFNYTLTSIILTLILLSIGIFIGLSIQKLK